MRGQRDRKPTAWLVDLRTIRQTCSPWVRGSLGSQLYPWGAWEAADMSPNYTVPSIKVLGTDKGQAGGQLAGIQRLPPQHRHREIDDRY